MGFQPKLLAVNSSGDAELPGWHGGPTVAESSVPIIFAMPGTQFVDSSGEDIKKPIGLTEGFASGIEGLVGDDKQLRNWHFGLVLKSIITQFRN